MCSSDLPENDMPPALKRVTSLTIHYLGLAADPAQANWQVSCARAGGAVTVRAVSASDGSTIITTFLFGTQVGDHEGAHRTSLRTLLSEPPADASDAANG